MKYKMNRWIAFALIVCVLLVTMGCDELLNRPVDVTGVTITQDNQTLVVGDTVQLAATVAPSDATNKDVTWSSDDEDIATVSSSGVVTAVAVGEATITVTTEDGEKIDSITVTVNSATIAVTGVTIAEEDQTILVGDTLQLTETVAPSDASNKNVTWTSDDEDVATVSSSGLVSAVAEGTATITVTTVDGGKTDSITITVNPAPIAVTGVTIAEEDQTILVGDTLQLNATVSPNDATNKDVAWSSSDTGVATVSTTGLVTPVAAGSTTITVTTDDGSKTDTISLTVSGGFIRGTLTPTDSETNPDDLVALPIELLSGPHETGGFDAYADITTYEIPMATYTYVGDFGASLMLYSSSEPVVQGESGGTFTRYLGSGETDESVDIFYIMISDSLANITLDVEITPLMADFVRIDSAGNENYFSPDHDDKKTSDPSDDIFTLGITFTDNGNESGYVKGTITGTVYDSSTRNDETGYIGNEYSLDIDFAVKIFDGNPPPEE